MSAALLMLLLLFGQVRQEPWSFALMGDLHSGGPSSSYLRLQPYTNSIGAMITNASDWNLKLVIFPGDCFDGTRDEVHVDSASISQMTNEMWRLKNAGISVFCNPGNHDADDDGDTNHWNDIFGTNFFYPDPAFLTSRTNGDMRDIAFAMTNSGMKVLIVGWRWAGGAGGNLGSSNAVMETYAPGTQWARDMVFSMPDHYVIGSAHFLLDTSGAMGTGDKPVTDPVQGYQNIGPGIEAWLDGFRWWPNALMGVCGHVRQTAQNVSVFTCKDGHQMLAVKWNTQGAFDGLPDNGGAFMLFTVYPTERYIRGRVFSEGSFMTNGQSDSVIEDFSFPFKKL